MNISLTPEFEELIQRHIATGMYTNASEVVRDALRHFEENDSYKALKDILLPRILAAEKEVVTESFDEIIAAAKREKYAQ